MPALFVLQGMLREHVAALGIPAAAEPADPPTPPLSAEVSGISAPSEASDGDDSEQSRPGSQTGLSASDSGSDDASVSSVSDGVSAKVLLLPGIEEEPLPQQPLVRASTPEASQEDILSLLEAG